MAIRDAIQQEDPVHQLCRAPADSVCERASAFWASSSCPSCGVHACARCRGTEERPEHDSAYHGAAWQEVCAGGETIDLQSLRGLICVVEGDRVGVTQLDTGGLWRRIRLVSGDPQTQDPLIPEYHIRATQQPEKEEWRNLESRRQIEIFARGLTHPRRSLM